MEAFSTQVSPELVQQQLQQLLKQEEFKRSPVLAKFLEFAVLTKLSSREDEIKEYTIAVKALGRPADFNPQLDAVVRIHAKRLRNILFEYYYGNGKEDPVIISIPKGAYVPLFEFNTKNLPSLPPQPTEINGHKRPAPLYKEESIKPMLAVLPFHDLSPEQSNDDFLAVLGEQLSMELSRFDNLSVISFYATRKLDAGVKNLNDIKNEGIDYILTGSLRLLNGTMRLNIQLMIVDTGNILWSDSFLLRELTNENAFDKLDEIISRITNAVADDPKMVSRLNKYMPWQNSLERSSVQDAIAQYFEYTYDYDSKKFAAILHVMENACETAADNALTISILSKLYLDQYACAAEPDKEVFEKGMDLAKKAVALDPRSQHAQKALAWGLILSGNKVNLEEVVERCIAINPKSASSLSTLGLGLIMLGKYEYGYSLLTQSLRLHQNAFACAKLGFALYYYHNKNYGESSKWLKLTPPFVVPFSGLLSIALEGNLNGRAGQRTESVSQAKGHEKDIVGRIALDPNLKTGIIQGWKLAGFFPQDITEN